MTKSEGHRAGRRAVRNSLSRAVGEIVGKVASLALLAVMARELGQGELGVFVFAAAYLQLVITPIGLGMDPYLLRQVARDRAQADRLFFDILAVKTAMALPVMVVAFAVLFVIEDEPHARITVAVLAGGILLDVVGGTLHALFNARERSDLLALTLIAQRVFTAFIGIAALAAGGGVVAVAGAYTLGALVHVGLGFAFVRGHLGMPQRQFRPSRWRGLARRSVGFAVQDVLNLLLFRIDIVILGLVAAEAAVGRYGAAYRLLESTMFASWALASGFSAMYSYLGPDTTPTVQRVFGRSIKLSLAILVPVAVSTAIFAEGIITLVYGQGFGAAADALRLLAPVIVLLSLVVLGSVLITSQRAPGAAVPLTLGGLTLNIALNFALIPLWEERGAAVAMLITETLLALGVLRLAHRSIGGGVPWRSVLVSPVLAGGLMAIVSLPLVDLDVVGLAAGAVVYVASLFLLERRFNPDDLAFARQLLRRSPPVEPRA